MPLTAAEIRVLQPSANETKLYDSQGLYLVVSPNGSKHWRMRYSFAGKERKLSFGNRLRLHTDATITDIRVIEAQIADCQMDGVAWDLEEHAEGICAVGTAFVDPLGRDFALSIPVPVARFVRKKGELAQQALAARDEIVRLVPGSRIPSDN